MHKGNTLRLKSKLGFILIIGALFFVGCNAFKSTDDKAITAQVQAKLFDDSDKFGGSFHYRGERLIREAVLGD